MKSFLFLLIGGMICGSCKLVSMHNEDIPLLADSSESSCPHISVTAVQNQLVLSWIRTTGPSAYAVCYAVSTDNSSTFGKTIQVPGTEHVQPHGENMPKIIFKPGGGIIAAWAVANPNPDNAYADLVYYAQSLDNGHTWTPPARLVTDTAGYDQRYFDMALLENGEVGICWLDNRRKTEAEGSALYFAETSHDKGFCNERIISENCCPCCRTDLFTDADKNIHILYRSILQDSIRDMVHIISTDNGQTFSKPARISNDNWMINGCPHTGPSMTENNNGLQFTWFTGGAAPGVYYCHSADKGKTFSQRQKVSGERARHSQITSLQNGKVAIVWNENFIRNNKVFSRIGMELRDAEGNKITTGYITPENGNATFPVLKAIDNHSLFVAYTDTKNQKDFVKYKLVKF